MIPQIKKPTNRGKAVLVIYAPIHVAIGTAIIVEVNPLIAAPIPAIWPIGSIANALVFPKRNPMEKNCNPKNKIRTIVKKRIKDNWLWVE